jgi:uroporphyrinogen III methyltransferase/synthase
MTRVVLTLSAGALAGLAQALASEGITVEECPLLRFEPPADWGPLDRALDALRRYRAVAFTSPRAAEAAATRWRDRLERSIENSPPVWTTGPATAAPLGALFGAVRMPAVQDARGPGGGGGGGAGEALAQAMLTAGIGSPVLYPCGEMHRDEFTRRLADAGIVVEEVICYRSVLAASEVAGEAARRADVLVVGSPRVAELLSGVCPPEQRPRLLALGPTTAAASRQRGWPPDAEAERPTLAEVTHHLRILGGAP